MSFESPALPVRAGARQELRSILAAADLVRSWFRQIADVARLLKQLRPYLGGGRRASRRSPRELSRDGRSSRESASACSCRCCRCCLAAPTPCRCGPIQWLQAAVPEPLPGVLCRRLLRRRSSWRSALKNAAGYVAAALLRASQAPRGRRRACAMRCSPRLQRAGLDAFDRRPGGNWPTSSSSRPSAPRSRSMTASRSRSGRHRALLRRRALLHFVAAHLAGRRARPRDRRHRSCSSTAASAGRARRLTDLNHRLSAVLEQSFAGIRVVRATNAQGAEIARFHQVNVAQADERGRDDARALAAPAGRDARREGDGDRRLCLHLLRAPGSCSAAICSGTGSSCCACCRC